MRILLVSNLYPPYAVGGYERLAAWTADGLRERGHDVQVLTGKGPAFHARSDVQPALDLDLLALRDAHFGAGIAFADGLAEGLRRHVFSVHNLRATQRAIESARPDVVSFWNPAFITFSPLFAARSQGVPAVVHLSDTAANPFRNPHPPAFSPGLRPAARLAVDGLLRFSGARRFVVPSVFLRDKLVRGEGLPEARVSVLPWPVPPAAGPAAAAEPREPRASRLLFVGSLAAEKGTRVLLEAFREAGGQRPDLTLTVIGDAGRDEVRRLRDAAAGLPVSFRGRLEHAEVLQEYARHDVLVFPSVWDEPFAIVPLEAAAMGLAVIATTAGGTPEAFSDRQTSLLVPPGDAPALAAAILALARDAPLARALAVAGQDHVLRTYGFSSFLGRLEALYDECRLPRGRPS
jgi:glycogen(starch) synthase